MLKSDDVREYILELLGAIQIRMTPSDLEGDVHRKMPKIQRAALRKVIKAMVTEGVLVYTNHYSTTHLEINFNRPVRVSERVILCPATSTYTEKANATIIKLQDGAAFGVGDHPTTRLCIQGLDKALAGQVQSGKRAKMKALDIGTGSGVLAMVAVGLGLGYAKGVDIDPLACAEAKKNVKINGMADRVAISNELLDGDDLKGYDVILANLRPPTLKQLFPTMEKYSASESIWVLSGFRQAEEIEDGPLFSSRRSKVIWRSKERGWAGLVLRLSR